MPMPIGPNSGSSSSAHDVTVNTDARPAPESMITVSGSGTFQTDATGQAIEGARAPAGTNSSCSCTMKGAQIAGGGSNERAIELLRKLIDKLQQLMDSLTKIQEMV